MSSTTIAPSLVASAMPVDNVPPALDHVRLVCRRELRIERDDSKGLDTRESHRWIVFDPISRRTFRIGAIEHWFLTRMDGKRSVRQLVHQFRQAFPDSPIQETRLVGLIDQLRRNELLIQGVQASTSPLTQFQSLASKIVVWQIRGLQPDGWLARWAPHTDLLFSAGAVKCWLSACLITSLFVLFEFQRLVDQSLAWQSAFNPSSGGLLLAVFLLTRAAHELGHALVCKRHGVRCPDIGVLMILGAPCVYCDVSESWRLTKRSSRAAVAAAGMYVELLIACVAAWIWLLTIESPISVLALQTMFVCSVSTVLINANPLMRFDGYYILADWLDETNLRAKADSLNMESLMRLVLGRSRPKPSKSAATPGHKADADDTRNSPDIDRSGDSELEPNLNSGLMRPATASHRRTRLLVLFSCAGWIYRVVLSATIATVLVAVLSNWGLPWLGRMLAVTVVLSWWIIPGLGLMQRLYQTATIARRRFRLVVVGAALIALIFFVPIPKRRFATGWIQPKETQGVFAGTTATMIACRVPDGARVDEGQPLFDFHNLDVELQAVSRQGDVARALLRYETQKRQRDMHGEDVDLTPYESDIRSAKQQRANAQREVNALHQLAASTGKFCAAISPAAYSPATSDDDRHDAPEFWSSIQQVGRTVEQGTLLGAICSDDVIAVLPLEESQLADIARGTLVRIRVPQFGDWVLECRVSSVVQFDQVSQLWQSLATPGDREKNNPAEAHFAAIVPLPKQANLFPGASVDATFHARSSTLASLASRWLKSNLRLLAD